jgi:hypothetical protein
MKFVKVFLLLIMLALNNCISTVRYTHSYTHKRTKIQNKHHTKGKKVRTSTRSVTLILVAVVWGLFAFQKVFEYYTKKLQEDRLKIMQLDHKENQDVLSTLKQIERDQCTNYNIYINLNKYLIFLFQLNHIFQTSYRNKDPGLIVIDSEYVKKIKEDTQRIVNYSKRLILNMESYSKKICDQQGIYGELETEDKLLEQDIRDLTKTIGESPKWHEGILSNILNTVSVGTNKLDSVNDDLTWQNESSMESNISSTANDSMEILDTIMEKARLEYRDLVFPKPYTYGNVFKHLFLHIWGTLKEFFTLTPQTVLIIALQSDKIDKVSYAEAALRVAKLTNSILSIISTWTNNFVGIAGKIIGFLAALAELVVASLKYHKVRTDPSINEEKKSRKLRKLLKAILDVVVAGLQIAFNSIAEVMRQGLETGLALFKLIQAKKAITHQLMKSQVFQRMREVATLLSQRNNAFYKCQIYTDTLLNFNNLFNKNTKNELKSFSNIEKEKKLKRIKSKNFNKSPPLVENTGNLIKQRAKDDSYIMDQDTLLIGLKNLCLQFPQYCSKTLRDDSFSDEKLENHLKKVAIYGPYSDIAIASTDKDMILYIKLGYEPVHSAFTEYKYPQIVACRKCSKRIIIDIAIKPTREIISSKCEKYFTPEVCKSKQVTSYLFKDNLYLIFESVLPKSTYFPAVYKIFFSEYNSDTLNFNKYAVVKGIYNVETAEYDENCADNKINNIFCNKESYREFTSLKIPKETSYLKMLTYNDVINLENNTNIVKDEEMMNRFELNRFYGNNAITFYVGSGRRGTESKASAVFYNENYLRAKKEEAEKFNNQFNLDEIKQNSKENKKTKNFEIKNFIIDPLKYNWVSVPYTNYDDYRDLKDDNDIQRHLKETSSDYQFRKFKGPGRILSFSPFSNKSKATMDEVEMLDENLCKTVSQNCATMEIPYEKSLDLKPQLGASTVHYLLDFDTNPAQSDFSCLFDKNSPFTVCKIRSKCKLAFLEYIKDHNTYTGLKVRCISNYSYENNEDKIESSSYVVLFNPKLSDYFKKIVTHKFMGRDNFVYSKPKKDGSTLKADFWWFLATKIDINDHFLPYFNFHGKCSEFTKETKGNLYKTMQAIQETRYINQSQIEYEISKYKECSNFSIIKKVKFSEKRKQQAAIYRSITVEDDKIVEKMQEFGPSVRTFYFIQITDKTDQELGTIYNRNIYDAANLGYAKVGSLKRGKLTVHIWAAFDFRIYRKLNSICPHNNIIYASTSNINKPEDNVIIDYYSLITKNSRRTAGLCNITSGGELSGSIFRDIPIDSRGYFDLRTSKTEYEIMKAQPYNNDNLQQYICVNKNKRALTNQFISYRKPPVVVYKQEKENFEKNFNYICSKPDHNEKVIKEDIDAMKTYDLTEGGKMTTKKYLCVYYTNDKEDEGISDIKVYPTIHKRICNDTPKFFINDFECDCTDINENIFDTFHMYICYKKGNN